MYGYIALQKLLLTVPMPYIYRLDEPNHPKPQKKTNSNTSAEDMHCTSFHRDIRPSNPIITDRKNEEK
uniref:Uncharacterized protein n=1 Tax=Arion vulgaris TaxID=1028688 RepID=A0A0B6Z8U6_9EUPU